MYIVVSTKILFCTYIEKAKRCDWKKKKKLLHLNTNFIVEEDIHTVDVSKMCLQPWWFNTKKIFLGFWKAQQIKWSDFIFKILNAVIVILTAVKSHFVNFKIFMTKKYFYFLSKIQHDSAEFRSKSFRTILVILKNHFSGINK